MKNSYAFNATKKLTQQKLKIMNDVQDVKKDAAEGIVEILTEHAAALAAVTQIAADLTKLEAVLAKIVETEGKVSADNSGAAIDKATKRTALEKIGLKVSKACVAFYLNANNNLLRRKSRYTKTQLSNYRDGILHSKMANLFGIADPIKLSLVAFNSGGADTALLNTTNGEFQLLIQDPDDLKKDKKQFTAEQVVNFQTMDGILNNLDTWVDTFEETEPTIWGLYKNRRTIYNTASIGTTLLSVPESAVPATGAININMDSFIMEDEFTIDVSNLGAVALKAGFGPNATTVDAGFNLNTGGHLKHTAVEWGFSGTNTFFNILNGAGVAGAAKVKVRDR